MDVRGQCRLWSSTSSSLVMPYFLFGLICWFAQHISKLQLQRKLWRFNSPRDILEPASLQASPNKHSNLTTSHEKTDPVTIPRPATNLKLPLSDSTTNQRPTGPEPKGFRPWLSAKAYSLSADALVRARQTSNYRHLNTNLLQAGPRTVSTNLVSCRRLPS